MKRAVFLDRDGTITKSDGYFYKHEQLEFLDDLADAIKILNKNFLVILITNQPVVARGLCTEEDVKKIHNELVEDMRKQGAKIDAVYFCPHHPERYTDVPEYAKKYRIECSCRKPGTALVEDAIKDFDIDIDKSFFIGDTTRDIQTAKNIGCVSILVRTGQAGKDGKYDVLPEYECDNIHEAAKLVDNLSNIGSVILVGGLGERLRPLTHETPKPMLPIRGKPIVEHQIMLLKKYGVTKIVVCGHYLFSKIKEYFGDGSKLGVEIEYIDEPSPLGTGGALKNARGTIKWDNFILLNGDIATNLRLSNLIKFHIRKKSLATQVLRVSDHPMDSDAVEIDDESRIVKFLGKGQEGVKTCNTGIAMLSKSFVDLIPDGVSNLEKDTLSRVILSGNVYGYVSDDYFKDVGTIERYEKVQKEFP